MSKKVAKCDFPELKSMKRLSKIPVIQHSVSGLNDFYEKAKEQNVERMHGVMDMATSIVRGVAFRVTSALGRPIKVVDSLLDKSLSFVELKVPAVHDPPNKLHEEIKNYIYTFWGGETAFTMVERIAATFRHLMEIIFISSFDQNIKLVRKMNSQSNSWIVKFVYSSVEVCLMTFEIIPQYLGRIFPSDCLETDHNDEEVKEIKETTVNSDQNAFIPLTSSNTNKVTSIAGTEKKNDSPNHSKQQ